MSSLETRLRELHEKTHSANVDWFFPLSALREAARIGAELERESCADECRMMAESMRTLGRSEGAKVAQGLALSIRARGNR